MAKTSLPNLNGNLLTESFDEKEIFLIQNGKEHKAGTTTEKLKYIEVNGHKAIERVQTLSSPIIGNRKGVTVVDRHTLKPISFTDFVDGVQKHKALYKNDAVHITDDNNRESVQTLNHSFDTFSVEMILRVLPLKEGFSIEFQGFNPASASAVDIYVETAEMERVKRNSLEMANAWKVKTFYGETLQYYWIDNVQRELLKQSSDIGEGITMEFRR
ncbi:hypothetical protein FZC79_15520 [Rossellomorea vietnamensis]|uniref:Uncharacterized protein n=2 Tax=Rossellomorea TaxID=2837508 RepID=A0A5D4KA13_9BACI|nr:MULTISPECIES: hypothetical protein [Rossellomorea]TYR74221.1 hypothetical protein FZC79_15520 [Rossellomorea vietnamensis]TYS79746.1 hypothetical protein FZC80_08870 [Rossellomorea aquimaris]